MISTRIEPLAREIAVVVREEFSLGVRARAVAAFAREQLRDGQQQNARVLGRVPPHATFVDGTRGAQEERVKPDGGSIVYQFELVEDVLRFIDAELRLHSPRVTGTYQRGHVLFADGAQVDPARPPPAAEYLFLNTAPYARKIERGLSPQAPDGVYEVVAALARRRFGNLARIAFTFRAAVGGGIVARGARAARQPAIRVSLR